MDFVDWSTHVLNVLIQALAEPENARKSDLDEIRLYHSLFGKDAPFNKSPRRDAMRDALKELSKEDIDLVEGHEMHWKPTRLGRERAQDIVPLWRDICSTQLSLEEAELLHFVNSHSQRTDEAANHVWLGNLGIDDLMSSFELRDRETTYYKFHKVASDLAGLNLLEVKALPGHHLNLKATYRGIVLETRRGLLRKCDVFISHISEESNSAVRLKEFLLQTFGNNLKVFVSSDYRSIGGGKLWFVELLEALKDAPVTLVLLSVNSVERRWINFEAGIGAGAGGLVIPLTADGFSKGEVGYPLSLLQVRSLDDAEDVEGLLSDIAEQTGRSMSRADAAAFIGQGQAEGGNKLEAMLNYVPGTLHGDSQEHALLLGLINNSSKTLTDYRVEIEVPNTFINQSTIHSTEVESRRTPAYRLFRREGKDETLRPGDRVQVFWRIDLLIPVEEREGEAFNQKVTVMVFAGDSMTQKIEKSVREILAQPPSFG